MAPELEISLDQSAIERWFHEQHGADRWTTLYLSSGKMAETGIGLYSCLIPPELREKSLKEPSWDLMIGSGGPGFSQEWREDEVVTTYHRMGGWDGIEPIVIVRIFHHGRPRYVEITEELRLLSNLFENRQTGTFFEAEKD